MLQKRRIDDFYYLTIVFLLLSPSFSYAQQAYGDINQRIIPAAPNVASLLKFNEVPVNSFNGTADVSIPLLDVKESNTNISLSYHTGGIRVNEEASWVGLGWNLNVGGVIQEIIVGEPDNEFHGFDMSRYADAPKPNSAFANPVYSTFDGATNLVESGLCYLNSSNAVTPFQFDLVNKGNFEYDVFSFNFSGYSGKCIFPDLLNGVCLDRQNIVFKKLNSPTTSIQAITPDGTQYFFETIGITATSRVCEPPPENLDLRTRTWYLTRIVYTNKRQVTFSYTKTTSRTLPALNMNWTYTDFGAFQGTPNQVSVSNSQSMSTVDNLWLSEVDFDNGKLVFGSSPRLDMENSYKLDYIRLYKNTDASNPVKEVKFTYDYFLSFDAPAGNDWTLNTSLFNSSLCSGQTAYQPSADFKRKRLKLTKVVISDTQSTPNQPAYSFQYNSTELPPKTSLSQDLWGFYNGENTNSSEIPDYNNLGYWDNNVPYAALNLNSSPPNMAKREANAVFAQASTLKGIVYPTGAYSAIRYESNQVSNSSVGGQNIVNNFEKVTDISTGIQQQEFTVPSIGYQVTDPQTHVTYDGNPATIHVTLFCCGYRGTTGCNNGYCIPYNPNFPNKGLYALLEYYNTQTNQWTLSANHIYDLSKTVISNAYGDVDIPEGLVPGRYRITANYPDDAPVLADYSKTIASIMVSYKDIKPSTASPLVTVGGLRVKGVVNYNSDGSIANQKSYTYKSGQLMVMPLFYRTYNPVNVSATLRADCSANHEYDDRVSDVMTCSSQDQDALAPAPFLAYNQYSLYSNPVLNYSYSAMGALVGYDTVAVAYDDGAGKNGKTELIYNCLPDNYNSFNAFVMPGTPTTPYLQNGTLKTQTEFTKVGISYIPVKETDYTYNTFNTDIKWCFKTEYHPPLSYGFIPPNDNPMCTILPSSKIDLSQLLLHFYPIKFGKSNVVTKTETLFNTGNPIVTTTMYDYNNTQQVKRSTLVNSTGRNEINETYYPSDYTVTTGFISDMQQRNMLNYNIESINKIDNLAISAKYNEFSTHDDMVTPLTTYLLKTAIPIAVTPSAPLNTKDVNYEPRITFVYDANGNLKSQQQADGILHNYLWDYNSIYPIGEVTNALASDFAYTSFEAESTGNWTVGSSVRTVQGKTGVQSYSLTNGPVTASVTSGKTYTVSYWSKTTSALVNGTTAPAGPVKNGWTYFEHKLSATTTTVTVSGGVTIDELRLHPDNAQMGTLTYIPFTGENSITDTKGLTSYYEYDSYQRLMNVKDQDGNIIKNNQYNYNSTYNNGSGTYSNIALSKIFTKNDCAIGTGFGTDITYQVPAGKYSSTVHPGDANEQAFAEIESQGQLKANTQGQCAPPVCSTPFIYNVASNAGLAITVTVGGASPYAGTQILFIKDPNTGQVYSNVSAPVTATSIPATVPTKGRTYRFVLMTTGAYCNAVSSPPVDIFVP